MSNVELLKSLRVGDVVRARFEAWSEGAYIEGPIHRFTGESQGLYLGGLNLNPNFPGDFSRWTFEILSSAPRFYANADRDPVVGDLATTVLHADDKNIGPWYYTAAGWVSQLGRPITGEMPATDNILLFDGQTRKPVAEPPKKPVCPKCWLEKPCDCD